MGLYTSPHLIRFTERIKVNGKEIEEKEVAALTGWMRREIEAAGIAPPFTFFDFTTAMALSYFNRKMVDLAILEVGLGGRLDSTNVVDPLISIITNVAKDHEAYLGKTILKIAGEKAGIIKKGRPLITAATQPRVLRLFSKICQEKRSPFFRVGKEFRSIRGEDGDFDYEGLNRKLWGIHLNLKGLHQVLNATTALGAMEVLEDLGYPVSTAAMIDGLREVDWPGRLELVSSSPRVILDGAHNPAGALVSEGVFGERVPISPPHPSGWNHEGQRHPFDASSSGSPGGSHHSHPTSYGPCRASRVAQKGLGPEWEESGDRGRSQGGDCERPCPDPEGRPPLHYRIPLHRRGGESLFPPREEIMRSHPFILGFFFLLFIVTASSSGPCDGRGHGCDEGRRTGGH